MRIKKKAISFGSVCTFALCLGIFTTAAFATNEASDSLAMGGVNDAALTTSESVIADEASGVTVEGEVPSDVELDVSKMEEESYNPDATENVDEVFLALDIAPTSDGAEWQPAEGKNVTVTVDLTQHGIADGSLVGVVHDDGEVCEILGEFTVVDGAISFETSGFSDFYFYVKFEHSGFSFTLSGGGEAYLSEILDMLSVNHTVGEVVAVEFSDDSLVAVERADDDWLLTSLKNFGTEEKLIVTFSDGEIVEIAVTDPVIFNYAVSGEITNIPLEPTMTVAVGSVTDGDKVAAGNTYEVNKTEFTTADISEYGVSAKDVTEPPALTTVHMRIYVKPGMAIRFKNDIYFTADGSHPVKSDDDIWFWAYSSEQTCNYVIVEEGTAGQTATFRLQNKSTATDYCNVQLVVVDDSKPVLLESVLDEASAATGENYSIKTVPVTLYNYDGKTWNEYYNSKGGNYLAFAGTVNGVSTTENATNRGWTTSGKQANGGGSVALMGIVKDTLVNGLPVMSQGQQVDLFSGSSNAEAGKTVYNNVGFQFIYNEDTGYYSYNAAYNHAQYNSEANEIQLYKQSLSPADIPTGGSSQMGNAGFYPFEDINKSYTNAGYQELSWQEWADALEADTFTYLPAEYAADIVSTSSTDPASTVELHYGLQVNAQFYLPEGKKINDKNMVYNFTGDDDLWVFIDGKLVLDIGGGHTHVAGSFDLTTGEVWISNYSKLSEADGGYYKTAEYGGADLTYTDSFLTGLEEDQMHTIQIFYLERHAGISNCKMHFNIPLTPTNAVEVSKSLELVSGIDSSVILDESVTASDGVHGAEDYTFTVYVAEDDDDNVDATGFTPLKGATYRVMGAGIDGSPVRTTSAEDGSFTLKAGQTAYFEGVKRFTEVYVVESNPPEDYEYTSAGKVSVNSGAAVGYEYGTASETKVMQKNKGMTFNFTNYMVAQDLTITKEGISTPLDHDVNASIDPENAEYQSTVFTVAGPSGTFEAAVKGNGSVVIEDLIPGTYTVTEGNAEGINWAWRYVPDQNEKKVVLKGSDGSVTFANKRSKESWLGGDNWCSNIFMDGKVAAVNALSPQENS